MVEAQSANPKGKPEGLSLLAKIGLLVLAFLWVSAVCVAVVYNNEALRKKSPVTAPPSAAPAPIRASPILATREKLGPEREYLELLYLTMEDLRTNGLVRQESDVRATWQVSLGSMSAVVQNYQSGSALELSDAGKAKQGAFKREYTRMQARTFPRLRSMYGKALAERLWEHDVDVSVSGGSSATLRLTGFWFASNRAIKEVMEAAELDTRALRFKRVEFRMLRSDNPTYYDLNPLSDSALATLAYSSWTEIE